MTDDLKVKAPDVAVAFDHASKGVEKKVEQPKPTLEHRPPGPSPMGMRQQPAPLVSPQLRRDEKVQDLKKAMMMAREFRRAARDGFER